MHELKGPVWLLQPIPYFGELLKGEWIVEPKIDGWRMQIIRYADGRYELWGRRLEKNPHWTEKLGWILKNLEIPKGTLLDCELYSDRGRRFIPSLFARERKAKPIVFIFDIIFFNNKYIGNLPLKKRKEILQKFDFKLPFCFLPYEKLIDIHLQTQRMVDKGYEGIVIKELNSLYPLGKDAPLATDKWRKIKA